MLLVIDNHIATITKDTVANYSTRLPIVILQLLVWVLVNIIIHLSVISIALIALHLPNHLLASMVS
jgi:hypothetical protein